MENMTPQHEYLHGVTRRHFLHQCHVGLGGIALASLAGQTDECRPYGACRIRLPRGLHIFRHGRSKSSSCTWPAGRRTWSCSTTSQSL